MVSGKVVKWVEEKGFGFLRVEGQQGDVFVHISAFGRIPRSPRVGEQVEIEEMREENGKKKATRARIQGLMPLAEGRTLKGSPRRKPLLIAIAILVVVGGIYWGIKFAFPM